MELIPDETEASITQNNMRINPFSGVPMALYKPNYPVIADTPERMAKQFLTENHELFKLSAEISELKYITTKETPGGYHVHFDQYIGEYPVWNSRVNVTISRDNRVVFVTNGSKINYNIKVVSNLEKINISSEQACQMNQIVLEAEKRDIAKKSDVKKLRASERVPGVAYGDQEKPTALSVDVPQINDSLAAVRSARTVPGR